MRFQDAVNGSITSWEYASWVKLLLHFTCIQAVAFAFGGIIAAPAIGALIGAQMGLYGAAATSAGLAWLGGGAIAAGGFGMAGGTAAVAAASAVAGSFTTMALLRSAPELKFDDVNAGNSFADTLFTPGKHTGAVPVLVGTFVHSRPHGTSVVFAPNTLLPCMYATMYHGMLHGKALLFYSKNGVGEQYERVKRLMDLEDRDSAEEAELARLMQDIAKPLAIVRFERNNFKSATIA